MDHPPTTQWAPWLLRARVTPPRDLQQHIPRPRVMQALSAAARAPIVVLDAPPGFGKTAALVEWTAAQTEHNVRTAWLTLDAADDPESVLRYLAFALHKAGMDVSGTGAAGQEDLPSHKWARELQSLLARVERETQRWLLVIDDLDTASAAVLAGIISPLLKFAPASLTLALAMRGPVALDLSGPASRALVQQVDRRELRFDRDEIRLLWGRAATEAQIRAVERRSEGWPALVQLMREHGAILHFRAQVGTPNITSLRAFFEFRVLQRLSADSRDLAQRLSLLPSFTVDTIAELTGVQTAGALLEALSEIGIVHAVNVEGGAALLTMHPLFREYVAGRFAAADPRAVLNLRYAAARVYSRLELQPEAVQIALATADADFIGETVESCDPVLTWLRHGTARLRQLVRRVPDGVLLSHPRAGYGRVIYWVKEGRLKDAQSLFDRLEKLPPGASEPLDRALCHSMLAVYKGTPISPADVANLERLSLTRPDLAPSLGCLTNTLHCYLQQHDSQFAAARESARRAIRDAELAKSPYAAFFEYCDLAMLAGISGDAPAAFAHFQEGERACLSSVRADERLALIRDAFRLEIEHELDPLDVTEMSRLRNLFLRLPRLEAWLDVFAAVYRTYSEKLLLQNDLTAALAVIDAGLGHVRDQEIENVAPILLCQQACLLACCGRTAAAAAVLKDLTGERGVDFSDTLHSWRQTEAFVEAVAMQRAAESMPLLNSVIHRARRTGNIRSELRFRRLRMMSNAQGDDAARVAELEASSGFRRAAILTTRQLGVPPAAPQPGAALFTPREMAVLEKLDEGLTDKSIAIALGITAHGVRHHLKRIYVKLNVRDRAEARDKARQAGIRFPGQLASGVRQSDPGRTKSTQPSAPPTNRY
ncbi:MAG TPA: LuxR C-terminal-related transcriptional regulator [Steroidobacteraceae bacterium]|nr:LuxR C-terminal-related transcriptional regulator [Steroidobacteraceae bacterium]